MNPFFQLIIILVILFLIVGIGLILFVSTYFKKLPKLKKSDIVPTNDDAFRVMQQQVKEFIDKKDKISEDEKRKHNFNMMFRGDLPTWYKRNYLD
jgi:small-conductance mechanosensitive channel